MFCIESILARQEGRLYKAGFFDIGIQRLEILVTPKQDLAFLFQLGKSFQARSLLCLFTTGPTRASGLRGLPTFMGLKPAVTASPKVLSCPRGTMIRRIVVHFLARFQCHLAHHFLPKEVK